MLRRENAQNRKSAFQILPRAPALSGSLGKHADSESVKNFEIGWNLQLVRGGVRTIRRICKGEALAQQGRSPLRNPKGEALAQQPSEARASESERERERLGVALKEKFTHRSSYTGPACLLTLRRWFISLIR